MLLNTSFNVRGEPIVCALRNALSGYFRTGLDALVIGPFTVTEKPQALIDRFSRENVPFLTPAPGPPPAAQTGSLAAARL